MTWLLVLAVGVGAASQRVTGMGFALVAAPFAVLAQGAARGVVLVCLLGALGACAVLVTVHRDIDRALLVRLLAPASVGVLVGAVAIDFLPPARAQVVAGLAVLAAVLVSTAAGTARPIEAGGGLVWAFGVGSGVMSAVAGLAGPALAAFALLTRWRPAVFVATVQPYFIAISLVTVLATLVVDPTAWPTVGAGPWTLMAVAVVLGAVGGGWVAARLPAAWARVGVLVVSVAGGSATVVDGLLGS